MSGLFLGIITMGSTLAIGWTISVPFFIILLATLGAIVATYFRPKLMHSEALASVWDTTKSKAQELGNIKFSKEAQEIELMNLKR